MPTRNADCLFRWFRWTVDFRTDNEDNPREAEAKGVIQTSVVEGYSLRHAIVEALLFFDSKDAGHNEFNEIVKQLQDLILTLERSPTSKPSEAALSNSFLNAVKQFAKSGVTLPTPKDGGF